MWQIEKSQLIRHEVDEVKVPLSVDLRTQCLVRRQADDALAIKSLIFNAPSHSFQTNLMAL